MSLEKNKFASKVCISHEEFIKKVDLVNPNREWEIIGTYEHNKIPILVKDKYGECLIKPNAIINNFSNPSVKTAVNKTQYSINKFKERWGNEFDYSKFIYKGTKIKSTIICEVGHEFEMTPNDHLNNKGCKQCSDSKRGDSRRSTTEEFISKARLVHKEEYNYSNVNYTNAFKKVTIICPQHGEFKQKPNSHLNGAGCLKCAKEKGGYNKTKYMEQCNYGLSNLYIVEFWNDEERFFKIGITKYSTEKRFRNSTYSFTNLFSTTAFCGDIYDMEKKLFRQYKEYKYLPFNRFQGYTECFNLNLPIGEIINTFTK